MHWDAYKSKTMLALSLSLYICAVFISETYATYYVKNRPFHTPPMCHHNGTQDCSFQFSVPGVKQSCLVYDTNACKANNFPPWNLSSLSTPALESDSEFTVSILPYPLQMIGYNPLDSFSALNISLTSLNKRISGFSIILTEDSLKANICRLIDFRKALHTVNIPFTLFYDCYRYLVKQELIDVMMTFKAYPLNIELSYLVHIPEAPNITIPLLPCDWNPVVMIFRGSLPNNHIQMKFSNAPKELNITYFILILWNYSGEEVYRFRIPFNVKEDMISREFIFLGDDFYSISISIITEEKECQVFKTKEFFVGNGLSKDYTLITFWVLLVIMIVSGSVLLYFSCRWYLKSAGSITKPNLLFVYHYKPHLHEFLLRYGEYLENHYGVKVNTIYKGIGDSKAWLKAKYIESHIIIFVVSEGLFQIFENNNISYEPEHHWMNQLSNAEALIDHAIFRGKKICKICFPFSGRQHVPKSLEHWGPFLMLPDDEDTFLCFIHGCSKKLYLLNKLCCEKHHRVPDINLKLKDDKEIKKMLMSITENKFDALPVVHHRNTGDCSVNDEHKLHVHIDLDNSLRKCGDENTKSVQVDLSKSVDEKLQDDCKKESDTLNQKHLSVNLGDSSDKCEEENLRSPEHEADSKQLTNDDFLLYCVRKVLSSE